MHVAWDCPLIFKYWEEVSLTIRDITGHPLDCSPKVMLLGYVEHTKMEVRRLTAMLLVLAKRRLAIHWGSPRGPTIKAWLQDAAFCQEQLSNYWDLMPTASRRKDIWDPLVTWLRLQGHPFDTGQ